MTAVVFFMVLYVPFALILVLFGYFVQRMREAGYFGNPQDHIDIAELVVIIPFRNEEARIDVLLRTISQLSYFPKEFIFVDDHSNDRSVELIKGLPVSVPYRIESLPEGTQGKKAAIRQAVVHSESSFILTLDADVALNPDYFLHISRLSQADMYILPAVMIAKRFHEHVYEVDLLLVNAVNMGLAGLKRPIIASGANLLFRRQAFNQFDRLHTHAHMPSGDDIYLLRDFRMADAKVRLVSAHSYAVHTETPQTLQEFLHQRLRWIAKTGDVRDHLSTALSIIQFLFTISFVVILIYAAMMDSWGLAARFYVAKTAADMLIFLPFFNRSRRVRSWLFVPFYELFFPIYSFVILFMMYWYKPIWKGRKLETNY